MVLDLASTAKKHYRGILTANLYYVLRKDGVSELVGENEFKTAKDGFTEFPVRDEIFSLLWYSSHNDPFSWIGDEIIARRATQVYEEADKNIMIKSIKSGFADFRGTRTEDKRFYSRLINSLAARITLLENAKNNVTIDFSGRIRFMNRRIQVMGNPGSLVRVYCPEDKSFIPRLGSNDAYRILRNSATY